MKSILIHLIGPKKFVYQNELSKTKKNLSKVAIPEEAHNEIELIFYNDIVLEVE